MTLPPHFAYRGDDLQVEGVPIAGIADRFGTPAYVYSKAALPLCRWSKEWRMRNQCSCPTSSSRSYS